MHHVRRIGILAGLGLLLLSTSGCVNRLTANVMPGSNLESRRSFQVLKHAEDTNEVAELIQQRLIAMNFQATVAPTGTAAPAGTDAVVVYTDKWMWDMTMYMVELTITFRDPKSEMPLATGNAFHGSLTRRSPKAMVDEVLTEIFKSGGAK